MKVIVVGLGSMGRRRIRLMKQYDDTLRIIGIDSNPQRIEQAQEELGIEVLASLEEAFRQRDIDCGFVCTSPLSHSKIIPQLIAQGIHVFTEINLVADGYDRFVEEKAVKLFLSSTFLYRKDIQWITEQVRDRKVDYIYHTGQYLPDWHPWENYQKFFVGDARTNGCREIFAIELPWILNCFGEVKSMKVIKDKMSDLKIDYPDNYQLQIEHQNGSKGLLAVDIIARKPMRRLEVYNENMHIFWDGTPNSLQEWDFQETALKNIPTYNSVVKDKNYCDNIIENAYMDEIDAFFSWLGGDGSKVKHDFKADQKILKLIDEIEA